MKIRKLNEDPYNNEQGWRQNGGDNPDQEFDTVKVAPVSSIRDAHRIYTNSFTEYNDADSIKNPEKRKEAKSKAVKKSDAAVAGVLDRLSNGKKVGTKLLRNTIKNDEGFLTRWIQSMKWDELEKKDNNFVATLKLNDAKGLLNQKNSFVKIYNKYANELYDADKHKDVSEIDSKVNQGEEVNPGELDSKINKVLNAAEKNGNPEEIIKARKYRTVFKTVQNEIKNK